MWHGYRAIGTPAVQVNKSGVVSIGDRALRIILTAAHDLRKLVWLVRRPRTFGAHALALTPEGRVILVKLRYAPGWRLPGGGRGEHEEPGDAVLRELREEIGMTAHGDMRLAAELDEAADFKRDLAFLFIIEEVEYRPTRWSWEIESIVEAQLDRLPSDLSPRAERWISAIAPHL